MSISQHKNEITTAVILWFGAIAGIRLFGLIDHLPVINNHMGEITALILIVPALIVCARKKYSDGFWVVSKKTFVDDTRLALIVSVLVFPAAILINHFYQGIFFGWRFHADTAETIADWTTVILAQVVLVAFPEEFLFRGFLRDRLNSAWPTRSEVFGAPFGLAQVLLSIVFALSHSLLTLRWWHAFIFFPALTFAWLREKTGRIWAGVIFHAACNIFSYWAALHYHP